MYQITFNSSVLNVPLNKAVLRSVGINSHFENPSLLSESAPDRQNLND